MSGRSKNSITVGDLCSAMEQIAPPAAAADWDNVGLLVGAAAWPANRMLLTIDLTGAVLDEAVRGEVDAIIAYHPPIFRAVKRLVPDRGNQEGLAAEALSRRIAIYSPHTALDAAPGGTNDTMATLAGLQDTVPFESGSPAEPVCKLVVFVPEPQVDAVAEAVFEAGAGRIGDYEKCSYRLRGEGTFLGGEATQPVVGKKGRFERVEEVRLEVVLPRRRMADVIAALRRSHPYEEPAFDIYPLDAAPVEGLGQGRIGRFAKPVALGALAGLLVRHTRAANATIVGHSKEKLRRGFVCVGAAGSLPFEIPDVSCGPGDVIITGEIRHHDALRYRRCGAAAIALGHWASERPVLGPLAKRLQKAITGIGVRVSRRDCDPFERA